MPPGIGYGKGVRKRTKRILAKGQAGSKAEARKLAQRRASKYRRGGRNLAAQPIGPGKKGSLKREAYKQGIGRKGLKKLRASVARKPLQRASDARAAKRAVVKGQQARRKGGVKGSLRTRIEAYDRTMRKSAGV